MQSTFSGFVNLAHPAISANLDQTFATTESLSGAFSGFRKWAPMCKSKVSERRGKAIRPEDPATTIWVILETYDKPFRVTL